MKIEIDWYVLGTLVSIALIISAITLAICYTMLGDSIFFSRAIPNYLNPVFIMVIAIGIWLVTIYDKKHGEEIDGIL